ncbi:MAG: iron transporter permease [Bacillales bacterium]|jgi:iron complex transport system permease protein|nr:iron transporter permease [Bacillales bacterium]
MLLKKFISWYSIAFLMSISTIAISLLNGSVQISTNEIFVIIGKHLNISGNNMGTSTFDAIIWDIRLPRVLLAFFVGASLALSGAALQGLFRNPLVEPYTIGVSSGASLGAVIVLFMQIQLGFLGNYTLPIVSICGSILSLFLVLFITKISSRSFANETIILTGIILNSFIGALVTFLISTAKQDSFRQILFWLMGSVSMRNWGHVGLIVPFFVVAVIVILFHYRELNTLALGDEAAHYIGVNVKRKRTYILTASAVLTGAAVAVSGAIGFVGLVIPHLVRLLIGSNHKHVLPFSLVVGGTFLVFADLIARTILSPSELPIGVVTAFIGAPIFGYLLIRQQLKRKDI